MKKTVLFLFFVLLFFACSSNQSQRHESSGKRIISLAPSLTKSLYWLEAQEMIIGKTSFCMDIENAVIVASVITPNIERIVALQPDIVITTGTLTSVESIATLRRLGIEVLIFDTARSFDDLCSQFIQLGELIDQEEKAKEIVRRNKERVEQVTEKIQNFVDAAPNVFFQIGANPIFTVLPNTFMDDYIRFLGGRNIAEHLSRGTVGREFVLSHNPDYIFIAIQEGVDDEEKREWSRHSQLSAVQNNRIFTIDPNIACLPMLVTFADTMEIIYSLISN